MQQNESVTVAQRGISVLAHLVWIMATWASNHTISPLGNLGKSECSSEI